MKFFLSILFFFFTLYSFSQSNQNSIQALAKIKNNAVLIRWAPASPYIWQMGNKYGYIIERFTVLPNGTLEQKNGKGRLLSTKPVKAYSSDELLKLAKTEPNAEVIQEAIYGKSLKIAKSPAEIINNNRETENKFGLALFVCDMSQSIAIAAGLMWIDRTVVPKAKYIYSIRIAFDVPNAKIEPGIAVVDILNEKPLVAPKDVKADFGDRKVTLTWPIITHKGVYTAYFIEKSLTGKDFKSLSDLPYVNTSQKKNPVQYFYVDSLVSNDEPVYYRVKGITPFGETGPASAVVSGQGKNPLEAVISIDSSYVINNKKIYIKWNVPAQYKQDITGFFVSRSGKAGGPFVDLNKKILPAGQNYFIDESPGKNNYYRIKYLTKIKNGKSDTYFSFPYLAQLYDVTPPAAPTGLSASVDSTGIVTLKWKAGTDNDLFGYRVYRANTLKEEFIEITPKIIRRILLMDTINIESLTRRVYYKVVAVDNYYNPSEFSSALELLRPDKIAPSAPVFSALRLKGDTVNLNWVNSSSNDAAKYILYRNDKTSDSLTFIKEWSAKELKVSYSETGLPLGKKYRYILQCIDSAGNYSRAISRDILVETGARAAIQDIKITTDRLKNTITLKWKYALDGVEKIIIYKSKDGSPYVIYKTLEGMASEYEDTEINVNNKYAYKIKAFFKTGAQSMISKEVIVEY